MVNIYTSEKDNAEKIKVNFELIYKRNCKILDKSEITKRDFEILKKSKDYILGDSLDEFINDESEAITVIAENGARYNFVDDENAISLDKTPYEEVLYRSVKFPFLGRESLYGILNFSMYFAFQYIIALFFGLALILIVDKFASSQDYIYEISMLSSAIPLLIYCGLWIFFKYKDDYINQFKSFTIPNFLTKFLKYLLIGFALNMLFNILSMIFIYLSGEDITSSENQEAVELLAQNIPIYLFIFFTCIYAPIVEEFIFRYILIDKVLGFSTKIASKVLLSTVIFILIHTDSEALAFLSNPSPESLFAFIAVALQYAGITIALSYAYAKERNIYLSMLIHATFNLIATLAIF